ncbi:MAG: adenylyltransferase/cytidyltransferase family protein [Nitrospirae bacterium]|nr:adenylyltransferase/cytidyltransferase family protein [Nitrospirota bacterium]
MKKRVVVCAGTFDHFHNGHLNYLHQAKKLADELIVIVARDETVKRIKGFSPTDDENVRLSKVENTGIPVKVMLGNTDADLFRIVEDLKPDVIALGYDQRVADDAITERFPYCRVVRLESFQPHKYKSSFFRKRKGG